MTNDEQLMLAFQGGSQEAFTELFERYRQPIFGFFRRRLDDPARAEDLAQETFVAVLRAASRYEPRALFRTYLYAIALRLLSAERRKAAAKPRLRNALANGFHAAAESSFGFIEFLLNIGPALLLWALLLFWPARYAWRRLRRHAAKNAPANAA